MSMLFLFPYFFFPFQWFFVLFCFFELIFKLHENKFASFWVESLVGTGMRELDFYFVDTF